MADDFFIPEYGTAPTGTTNRRIAADEVTLNAVLSLVQLIKFGYGADGNYNQVQDSLPLPVKMRQNNANVDLTNPYPVMPGTGIEFAVKTGAVASYGFQGVKTSTGTASDASTATSRKLLIIQNPKYLSDGITLNTVVLKVAFGKDATLPVGECMAIYPGGNYAPEGLAIPSGKVSVISSTSTPYYFMEG